ncbi:hypothetical protein DOY81_001549 [Sarcophaga bullata]|nr:hypothetical protein DOY81_001549 [Sarcophaga bullata]
MKLLKNTLNALREAEYLTTKDIWSTNLHVKFDPLLLKNGRIVRDQLFNIWRSTKVNWVDQCVNTQHDKLRCSENFRLSFINNEEFRKNYEQFCKVNGKDSKSVEFRTISNLFVDSKYDEGVFFGGTNETPILIAEYFVDMNDGLEKFYNIQRERKIWWMRYSANPSRFFVEPYDLCNEGINDNLSLKSKSITIKAQYAFGLAEMETITLAPLNESTFFENAKFSVIRSVINLNLTTTDGKDHNRDKALMLNRKLAPYQVLLSHLAEKNEFSNKLILHIEKVIRNAGLRLYDVTVYKESFRELDEDLTYYDSLGIPYIVTVDKQSIKTGLIKLRSRETTLYETIHISDIPNYLLKIFQQ